MIQITFEFAQDKVLIEVNGTNVYFSNLGDNSHYVTIDSLRLNRKGVIKEFPDLQNNPQWKKEAIKRFKAHIKLLKNEDERVSYIIIELRKHGYKALTKMKKGFRPVRII